jgi:uncharacterized protein (DUF1684 family)
MKTTLAFIICLVLFAACESLPDPAYVDTLMKWRSDRVDFLKSEAGFINLAGLYWFNQGDNSLGSAEDNDVVLPADFPKQIANIEWSGEFAIISQIKGEQLLIDGKRIEKDTIYGVGKPKELTWSSYHFYVIKRADKLGLRVKNYDHPRLKEKLDIPSFPILEDWVIQGRFEPYDPPKTLMIQNIVGLTYPVKCPGRLIFEKDGQTYSLDPSMDGDQFYITFGDKTNGEETYGAGRYLYANPPDENGNVLLDFNKAYNPPCAFTEYATCPLPPSQNKLALSITAGEKEFHWDNADH